jgi:hypothetical protein
MKVATELAWFKSTHSSGEGGDCVEVAICLHTVHVRDSKDTNCPSVVVGSEAWSTFLGFAADRSA